MLRGRLPASCVSSCHLVSPASAAPLAGTAEGTPPVAAAIAVARQAAGGSKGSDSCFSKGCCSPCRALARSIGYPKGDLPVALVSVRWETRPWCCAGSANSPSQTALRHPCPAQRLSVARRSDQVPFLGSACVKMIALQDTARQIARSCSIESFLFGSVVFPFVLE